MRRILLPTLFALLISAQVGYAQSPPGINYQGIARNTDGKPLTQKNITIRINIVKDGNDGEVEYTEVHSATTNSFGLFTLVIGAGFAEAGDFNNITWSVGSKWLRVEMDPDGGNSFQLMGAQQFMSVPYAFYAKYSGASVVAGQGIAINNNVVSNTGDADASTTNELNTDLSIGSDHVLKLTDAGGTKQVDLSGLITPGSAPQDLSLNANVLKITDNVAATSINLGPYMDNTDNQNLTLNGTNQLSISNGNSVDLSGLKQDLSLTGNTLSLTGDVSTVNLLPYLDNTDNQDLSLTGNSLSLTNDPTATPVNLAPYLDNTDGQTLSISASDQLAITGGNNVNLAPYKQDLSITGNSLSLTNDPTATPVNLAPYLDNTDGQTLSISASDQLAITGGNNVNLAPYKQDLSITGNSLSLTNDPTATPVNLGPYLDNTDGQNLTLNGTNQLSISNGNSVDLSGLKQDLSLTGNTLSLTGDASTVNLLPYLDNTDNQDLSLTGNSLSLTNDPTATPVNLAPYLDNTDGQTLSINASDQLTITGGNNVNLAPYKQDLSLTGNNLSLTNDPTATPVNLAPYLDNTDTQDLSINTTTDLLSLTGDPTSTPVDLSPYKQSLHLSVVGNTRTITIDNGMGVGFSIDDGDSDPTNELQSLAYNSATKSLSLSGSPGAPVTINETQNLNQVLSQGTDANGQKITNLGAPTSNTDATTKMYVDNGNAAINARISANYSFKSSYTFSTLLAVSEVTLSLTDVFDDFNVAGTSSFQAQVAGTYMFVLDGTTTGLLASAGVHLSYNGTNYAVTISSSGQFNSTFMFKLNAGETVSVVATGLGISSAVNGTFFGYKLL